MTLKSNLTPIDTNELIDYHLGLRSNEVDLKTYHSDWFAAFEKVEKKLKTALDPKNLIRLEFIGSACLPGLPAKPVLDILIEFKDQEVFSKDIHRLEALGFEYKGDGIGRIYDAEDPERYYFVLMDRTHTLALVHLHARKTGYPDIKELLLFRDTLKKNPNLVEEYKNLKEKFLQEGVSRYDYTKRKGEFVKKVLKLAKQKS